MELINKLILCMIFLSGNAIFAMGQKTSLATISEIPTETHVAKMSASNANSNLFITIYEIPTDTSGYKSCRTTLTPEELTQYYLMYTERPQLLRTRFIQLPGQRNLVSKLTAECCDEANSKHFFLFEDIEKLYKDLQNNRQPHAVAMQPESAKPAQAAQSSDERVEIDMKHGCEEALSPAIGNKVAQKAQTQPPAKEECESAIKLDLQHKESSELHKLKSETLSLSRADIESIYDLHAATFANLDQDELRRNPDMALVLFSSPGHDTSTHHATWEYFLIVRSRMKQTSHHTLLVRPIAPDKLARYLKAQDVLIHAS